MLQNHFASSLICTSIDTSNLGNALARAAIEHARFFFDPLASCFVVVAIKPCFRWPMTANAGRAAGLTAPHGYITPA